MTKKTKKGIGGRNKEQRELQVAVSALQGTSHNPIAWAAVIRLLAPIIAGWAVRAGLTYYARKTGKRISPQVRDRTAEYTRELSSTLVSRIK